TSACSRRKRPLDAPPGNAHRASGGCKAARCRVLSRPGSLHYRGSLRPCIACFLRARIAAASPGGALMAVAHRMYARALFEAANGRGRLAAVREELGDFVAAVEQVPELDALLRNPPLAPPAKAQGPGAVPGG